ncbi:DNA-binding CsgD family transcriptional regulator [Nonomuraea thailandensis]|uniref:DNA-binding CsgD family transcriptional regulator n=1 Tax=Nonomuraea thailandensis TaxID=1188745 RepID=A0A9X2GGQ7_9ACTN|nr:helix-turn-helix transcriptional regulator [Nonomuraea thailandensis]MCP2357480.1 DNA-binding CsgD family transcriptional regulator [Nonomuraea thailandensis]
MRSWPYVGRDEELDTFRACLRRVEARGLMISGREVALLAVHHSSRAIAQRLGLSVATVNNNLARVYVKLGVGNRAQLAALLDATPPGG